MQPKFIVTTTVIQWKYVINTSLTTQENVQVDVIQINTLGLWDIRMDSNSFCLNV